MTKRDECIEAIKDAAYSDVDHFDAERIFEAMLKTLGGSNKAMREELQQMEWSGTYPWAAWSGMLEFVQNNDVRPEN